METQKLTIDCKSGVKVVESYTIPELTPEETLARLESAKIIKANEVKSKLSDIDAKSIRPIRENEPVRLAELVASSEALRTLLQSIEACSTLDELNAINVEIAGVS